MPHFQKEEADKKTAKPKSKLGEFIKKTQGSDAIKNIQEMSKRQQEENKRKKEEEAAKKKQQPISTEPSKGFLQRMYETYFQKKKQEPPKQITGARG